LSNKPAKEWLSSDTLKLVEERRNLKPKRRKNTENRRHYNYLCREIKRQSGKDRNICEEIETAHMQTKTKVIYDSVRKMKITEKQAPSVRVVKDKDGVVLVNQEQIKKRWGEHFQSLYNPHTMTDSAVFDDLSIGQRCGDETATIMRKEIEEAVNRLKKSKAPHRV